MFTRIVSDPGLLLSLIVFLPAAGAVVLAVLPKGRDDLMKLVSLLTTIAVFLLTAWMAIPGRSGESLGRFQVGVAGMQQFFSLSWIPTFNIY